MDVRYTSEMKKPRPRSSNKEDDSQVRNLHLIRPHIDWFILGSSQSLLILQWLAIGMVGLLFGHQCRQRQL